MLCVRFHHPAFLGDYVGDFKNLLRLVGQAPGFENAKLGIGLG